MKFGFVVGAAVLGASTLAACATGSPAAPTPPSASDSSLRVIDCPGATAMDRPDKMTLTCADANDTVTDLVWSTWSADGAMATGTSIVNDCTPDCADGHFLAYPVTITLFGTYPPREGTTLFAGLTDTIGGSYNQDFPYAQQPTTKQLPNTP